MRSRKASIPALAMTSTLTILFMYPHLSFLAGIKKISALRSFHLKMFKSMFLTDKHFKKKSDRNIIIKRSVNNNS